MYWILLLMAYYPDMQRKMRTEIDNCIGDGILMQEQRCQLNYVQAYIHECLRFRPVVPMSVAHKTMKDAIVACKSIPKNTQVFYNHWATLHDPAHWNKPEQFNPDRFLDETGKFTSNPAFVTFGIGRRACPGEKLALADLLFIVTRLLQNTKGFMLEIDGGRESVNLRGNHNLFIALLPFEYKLRIVQD